MLSSNDLNGLVEFLISKGANKITGQNFVLDDGFTLNDFSITNRNKG